MEEKVKIFRFLDEFHAEKLYLMQILKKIYLIRTM